MLTAFVGHSERVAVQSKRSPIHEREKTKGGDEQLQQKHIDVVLLGRNFDCDVEALGQNPQASGDDDELLELQNEHLGAEDVGVPVGHERVTASLDVELLHRDVDQHVSHCKQQVGHVKQLQREVDIHECFIVVKLEKV